MWQVSSRFRTAITTISSDWRAKVESWGCASRSEPARPIRKTAPSRHSVSIDAIASVALYLKIEARGRAYDFYYGTRPDEWMPLLRNADGTILSTKTAGGFVGTVIGMYAYAAGP